MKWIDARSDKMCTACDEIIPENTKYWGGSYQTFCVTCGKKYKSGKLRYSAKNKGYIDIVSKTKCDFCNEKAEYVILATGKSACSEHMGGNMSDVI